MLESAVSPTYLAGANLPSEIWAALAQEASQRDLVTTRRMLLIVLLWYESYLLQATLIQRVRYRLGVNCFGTNSALTFRRDMQAVKAILAAAGQRLQYSRRPIRAGYYIAGRPDLAPEIVQAIRGAAQEVDQRQIEAWAKLSVGERVGLASRLSDELLSMAIFRLRHEQPQLDRRTAQREVLNRYYQLNG
jgi:hypothetical protein